MANRMMRVVFLVLILTLAGAGVAGAAEQIGVVDIERVIGESTAGQEADQLLQAFVAERQQGVDKREAELDLLAGELEATADEEDRVALQLKIDEKTASLWQLIQELEDQIAAVIQNLRGQILSDIRIVLQSFGAEKGYDLLLDANAVVYVGSAADVTQAVIDRYDAMLLESRELSN